MAAKPIRRTSKDISTIPISDEMAAVLKAIRENKGANSVVTGSQIRQPWRCRTNIFTLDYALLGGIPFNRTTMIHGKKHGGKTTMAMMVAAAIQQSLPDQKPVWIDAEDTYDSTWGGKLGMDNDNIIIVKPDTGEEAVDMTVALAHAKETSLIVVDSLAALLPIKEEAGSAEDESIPGLQAKLITKMLRRTTAAIMAERKRGHYITLVVLNQHRALIGFNPTGHGKTLPGGSALGHFTSVEIHVKNKENINANSGILMTNDHSFNIEKNKCNAGMRTGEYIMLRKNDDEGIMTEGMIDDAPTMLTFAKKLGWYSGGGSSWRLEVGDAINTTFSSAAHAARSLYEDREMYENLRTQLIVSNAVAQGMPDDFIDYLLGN